MTSIRSQILEINKSSTVEYYLDQDLYNISMSALKEAMQEKSIPYIPL